jgi:hypothetical protein
MKSGQDQARQDKRKMIAFFAAIGLTATLFAAAGMAAQTQGAS